MKSSSRFTPERSTNVAMHRLSVCKPCQRCGIPVEHSHKVGVLLTGVCRDCRAADPEYVTALEQQRSVIPPRVSHRAPNWAERRRAQWEGVAS